MISADSHINEPPDLWLERIQPDLVERAPRVVPSDAGDAWQVRPDVAARPVGTSAVAGLRPEQYLVEPVTYKTMRPGSFDPVARLEDMDEDGIAAEVLYPGIGRSLDQFADPEVRLVCARIYNDWIAAFQDHDPRRLVGLAIIPPLEDGVESAAEELRRSASIGLHGAFLALLGPDSPTSDPSNDPFWAAAAETGLPISLHVGSGKFHLRFGISATSGQSADAPGAREARVAMVPMLLGEQIAMLIFGGVFERHPGLRIVIAESGIGWIPYFLSRLESIYDRHRHYMRSALSARPAEVFREHFFATFQEDVPGLRLRDVIGVANVMWASDYPHTDTTWPHSRQVVERDFAGVPDAERDLITSRNCADLYGIEVAAHAL
jgi:predicted TIM-barrel fold metal-dependent hydrolase